MAAKGYLLLTLLNLLNILVVVILINVVISTFSKNKLMPKPQQQKIL
jgi:hypothetical protein